MDPLSSPTDQPAPALPPIPAAPPKRRRFSDDLLAAAVALLIILFAVLISCIPGLLAGLTRKTASNTAQAGPAGFHLKSISMISPDEGWVAGNRPRSTPDTDPITGEQDLNAVEPIILHYRGGRWSLEQLPADLNPYNLDMTLSSISMVSATEGWASGSSLLPAYPHGVVDGITVPVLLHYTGGRWTLVKNPPAAFGNIVMRSAKDGWAIGQTRYPDAYGAVALHYNGTTWSEIKDPAFASVAMQTIAEAPDGEVWITGADYSKTAHDGDEPAVILHYDGSRWTRQQVSLANDRFYGLTMVSPDEGWAVGYTPGGTSSHRTGPQQALIAHYHNGVWQAQSTFAGSASDTFFYLSAVAMVSASEGWAVGEEGLIAHYLNGVWTSVESPTDQALHSIAMISPTEGWAVGNQGTILHYQNGAWSVFQS
jgi:photosystem II stability/assembly factor-like uncharacterized protein